MDHNSLSNLRINVHPQNKLVWLMSKTDGQYKNCAPCRPSPRQPSAPHLLSSFQFCRSPRFLPPDQENDMASGKASGTVVQTKIELETPARSYHL